MQSVGLAGAHSERRRVQVGVRTRTHRSIAPYSSGATLMHAQPSGYLCQPPAQSIASVLTWRGVCKGVCSFLSSSGDICGLSVVRGASEELGAGRRTRPYEAPSVRQCKVRRALEHSGQRLMRTDKLYAMNVTLAMALHFCVALLWRLAAREPAPRLSYQFAGAPIVASPELPIRPRRRSRDAAGRWPAFSSGGFRRSATRLFFALIFCIAGPAAASTPANASSRTGDGTIFEPVRIGAGGFIRGVSIAPDGTKVVKTDTYGAWTFDPAAHDCGFNFGCWRQCVTLASMPARDSGLGLNGGVYAIVVAPSRTNVFYMYFNGRIYLSSDRCATWTRTGFPAIAANPNSTENSWGQFIAVDPANADVVFAGTPSSGVYFTANRGASWSQIPTAAIPVATKAEGQGGGNLVAFDPASAVVGGVTQGV